MIPEKEMALGIGSSMNCPKHSNTHTNMFKYNFHYSKKLYSGDHKIQTKYVYMNSVCKLYIIYMKTRIKIIL